MTSGPICGRLSIISAVIILLFLPLTFSANNNASANHRPQPTFQPSDDPVINHYIYQVFLQVDMCLFLTEHNNEYAQAMNRHGHNIPFKDPAECQPPTPPVLPPNQCLPDSFLQSLPDDYSDSPIQASFPPSVGSTPPLMPEDLQSPTPPPSTSPMRWDPIFYPNYEFKNLSGDVLKRAQEAQERYVDYYNDFIRSRSEEQFLWDFKLKVANTELGYQPMQLGQPGKFYILEKYRQDFILNFLQKKFGADPQFVRKLVDDLTQQFLEKAIEKAASTQSYFLSNPLERLSYAHKACNVMGALGTLNDVYQDNKAQKVTFSNTPEAKRERERIKTSLLADELIKLTARPGSNPNELKLYFLEKYWGWEKVMSEYTHYVALDKEYVNKGNHPAYVPGSRR